MTSTAEPLPTESRYRWVMLALIWCLYGSFGMVSTSMAPLLSDIKADLEISDALMGTALGAWPLVYIFAAIPAGSAIDRFGKKRALAAAGIVIASSQLLRAVSADYPTLFLAIALFGLGGPLISIGAPATVADWFSAKERAVALGIYTTAPALGGVLALYSANAVVMPLTGESWRLTLVVFGSGAVLASIAWWLFARDAKQEAAPAQGEKERGSLSKFISIGRIGAVQIVLVMSVGMFLFGHGFSNWLPELLRRGGMTKAEAGMWASIPTIIGVAGALIVPRFVGQGQARVFALLVSFFAISSAAAFIIPSSDGLPQVIGLILLGLSRSTTMLIMLILMALPGVGPRNMGIAGGLYFTFGEIGGVLGPSLVGLMADTSGLASGFYMLGTVSGVLVLLTLILRKVAFARQQLVPAPA
jgi:cyanate permease